MIDSRPLLAPKVAQKDAAYSTTTTDESVRSWMRLVVSRDTFGAPPKGKTCEIAQDGEQSVRYRVRRCDAVDDDNTTTNVDNEHRSDINSASATATNDDDDDDVSDDVEGFIDTADEFIDYHKGNDEHGRYEATARVV
jgi:hypothetical protein